MAAAKRFCFGGKRELGFEWGFGIGMQSTESGELESMVWGSGKSGVANTGGEGEGVKVSLARAVRSCAVRARACCVL